MRDKRELRLKRHRRILQSSKGTALRPRLIVSRSLRNLRAEAVDDVSNKTILCVSTLDKEIRQKFPYAGNIKATQFFGEVFVRRAKEKGIDKLIFDRAGYLYQGRIKVFAEVLRKGGLQF